MDKLTSSVQWCWDGLFQLESLLKKFVTDQKVYASELRTKCGQLEYLKNLAKAVGDLALLWA